MGYCHNSPNPSGYCLDLKLCQLWASYDPYFATDRQKFRRSQYHPWGVFFLKSVNFEVKFWSSWIMNFYKLTLFRRLRRHHNKVRNFPKWTKNCDIRSSIRSDQQIVPPYLGHVIRISWQDRGDLCRKSQRNIWKFAHREKVFKRPNILKIQQNW